MNLHLIQGRDIGCHLFHGSQVVEVDLLEESMLFHIITAIYEIPIALRKVVLCQVLDKTFSIRGKTRRILNFFFQSLLENLVRIVVHERRKPSKQFVHEDSQSIPVSSLTMTCVHDYLRGHILWGTTKCVGPVPFRYLLNKSKIGQLDVAIVLK